VGVYRQADGVVARVDDDGTPLPPTRAAAWGPEVLPVAGDWDGDGRDDVAVLRRDTGTFELPGGDPEAPGGIRVVEVGALPGALPVAGDWNGRELVTLEELSQIFGPLPDEAAVAEGLPALNAAMLRAGISTPERKAAFLATLRNESGFRVDAVEAGDDSRWRGRGLIQLTGEHNYRAAAEDLGLDLVGNPDLALHGLASPAIAAWYWTVARCGPRIGARAGCVRVGASGVAPESVPDAATLCGREPHHPDRTDHVARQPDARDLQPPAAGAHHLPRHRGR
jgi:hypothetical protein